MNSFWQKLVAASLLGTESQGVPQIAVSSALGAALQEVLNNSSATKEQQILGAAAIIDLYERAGSCPKQSETGECERCADDQLPVSSSLAGSQLSRLLQEPNPTLVCEWLTVANSLGKRPPHLLLPPLLEMGVNNRRLKELLIESGSHRARWLAARNGRWNYMLQAAIDNEEKLAASWETGQLNERVGALRSLRKGDPQAALKLLVASWAQEPAGARAAFLAELQTNLNMEDEPFLEEIALDDKRKEVREVAIELLCTLPDSRLQRRMIARVQPCVTTKRTVLKLELDVAILPEFFDESMVRDGIVAKRQSSLGEKADWLAQMIGYVRPQFWCEAFDADPEKLVGMAQNNADWRNVFFLGWRKAIVIHRASAWAIALIPRLSTDVSDLVNCLDQSERESVFLQALAATNGRMAGNRNVEQAVHALMSGEYVLTPHCSKVLLELCQSECGNTVHHSNVAAAVLPSLALRLHPSLASQAVQGWRQEALEQVQVCKVLDKFTQTVDFRREMYEALAK